MEEISFRNSIITSSLVHKPMYICIINNNNDMLFCDFLAHLIAQKGCNRLTCILLQYVFGDINIVID
jgi:hypothetical protein